MTVSRGRSPAARYSAGPIVLGFSESARPIEIAMPISRSTGELCPAAPRYTRPSAGGVRERARWPDPLSITNLGRAHGPWRRPDRCNARVRGVQAPELPDKQEQAQQPGAAPASQV